MSSRTLFLDLASGKQCIALIEGEKTAALEPVNGKSEASLVPVIEKLVGDLKTIDRIAAVTGPGGFMSLRVGISLANALSDGLGVPLAGVHLSDVWRARSETRDVRHEAVSQDFLWVHSTKKEFLFVRGFGSLEKEWPEPTFLSIEAFRSKLTSQSSHLEYVGELIESQQAALPLLRPLTDIRPLESVLPTITGALVYEQKPLMPWYGRGA